MSARAGDGWFELRTPHFELITNAAERYSPGLLFHLEQLRRLFLTQAGAAEDTAHPVRVIAFRSESEYARYRIDDAADAYYVGAPGRDYIVMPLSHAGAYHIAAHEYAHVAVHRSGRGDRARTVHHRRWRADAATTDGPVDRRAAIA